jgi:hypothetical protein
VQMAGRYLVGQETSVGLQGSLTTTRPSFRAWLSPALSVLAYLTDNGEPQARCGERVLRAPGAQRRRGRGPDGRLEGRRAGRLEAVPAPCHQGKPYRGRAITLKAPKKVPRILAVAEMQAVLDACTRLRDRFFFAQRLTY